MVNVEAIAHDVRQEIRKEVVRMNLVMSGDFLTSIKYRINGSVITLYSELDYAPYLEFGTYEFGLASSESSPTWPAMSVKGMKKKDMSREDRERLPKGMVAFAPFRRVLYNTKLIQSIIRKHSK